MKAALSAFAVALCLAACGGAADKTQGESAATDAARPPDPFPYASR
jgi:hypothetical protein